MTETLKLKSKPFYKLKSEIPIVLKVVLLSEIETDHND